MRTSPLLLAKRELLAIRELLYKDHISYFILSNNVVEGWHNNFTSIVNSSHPPLVEIHKGVEKKMKV